MIIALYKSTFTIPYHLPLWLPVICNSLYTFLLSTVVFTYEDLEAFMYVFFAELFAKLTVKTLVADNFKFRTMTSYSLTPTNTTNYRTVFYQTCQVSCISRETHAFSMSLTLSLRTVEISRIFLLNEKQYFKCHKCSPFVVRN